IQFPTDDGKYIEDNWYKVDPERYERGLKSAGIEVGPYQNLQRFDVPYFRLYRNVVTHTGVMIDTIHFLHVLIDKEVEIGTMERKFWRKKYAGAIRLDSISQL
ncbi:MAG: peptidoglycan endopeptidase, partial [Halanaerobiaceae bacterium]